MEGKHLFQGQPKIVFKHSAQGENSVLEAEKKSIFYILKQLFYISR
jgi:hypothetical protein